MKTRQATKRNQQATVCESLSNLNNSVRRKKRRLSENSNKDVDAKTVTNDRCTKADVKEELSSDSSSDEFVKVNELDLNSDFFKPLKKNEFQEIENKIFSEVSRLSDSESALSEDDFEISHTQNATKSIGTSRSAKKFPVREKPSTSVANEKRRKEHKETVTKPIKKLKHAPHKKEVESFNKSMEGNSVNVSQLLALGEGSSASDAKTTKAVAMNGVRGMESDSDDSNDWENVEASEHKPVEHKIPKEGVEITLKFPGMYEKRKKKGFDWKAHMIRRLNRVKREIQVLVHKVHLLCWIAHGRYVNLVLNSSNLMAVALSLIPSDKCYPPKHSNLGYLEQFVSWFTTAVVLDKDPLKDSIINLPLEERLEVLFEKKIAHSKQDLVMMFVCTSRALGLKVRVVMSLQPLPLKPQSSELCTMSDDGKQKSTRKMKGEGTASNNANDEKPLTSAHKLKTKGKSGSGEEVEEMKRIRISKMELKKNKAAKIFHGKDSAVSRETGDKCKGKVSEYQKKSKGKSSTESTVKKSGKDDGASVGGTGEGRSLRVRKSEGSLKYRDSSSEVSGTEREGKKNVLERENSPKCADGAVKSESDPTASRKSGRKSRGASRKKKSPSRQSSGSEFEEKPSSGPSRQGSAGKSRVSKASTSRETAAAGSGSDSDFEPSRLPRRHSSQGSEAKLKKKDRCDVWAEVFLEEEEKWISVDVHRGKIHCVSQIYGSATHPVTYVLGFNNDQTLKDVTRRYCPQFHTVTRRLRVDPDWWSAALKGFMGRRTAADREEDDDMDRQLEDRPLPSTVSEYKNHPLYALKRHLLKFEAIYPPDAPPLGFVRGEPVYARECVKNLHSREVWVKEAKVVRPGEQPYKIVKARPKYDRMTGQVKTDLPLEVFGDWQIEDYVPPAAEDGKVPRNEYGNVELFKPCMLPKGTVHLQIPGLNRVAKKLNIDCASAVVGFDFHSGGSHPTFDGFVVCEEFAELLMDAWEKDQEEQEQRQREKLEKRVYGNWKLLIRGLLIRERLKARYSFGKDTGEGTSGTKLKPKKSKVVGKKSH